MTLDTMIETLTMLRNSGVKGDAIVKIREEGFPGFQLQPVTGFVFDENSIEISTEDES